MRFSPSVISLIESHLAAPVARQSKAVRTELRAIAPTLQPAAPKPATLTNGSTTTKLSLKAALRKYSRNPSVALAVAHSLLNDHASEPSTSSRVSYLLRRQRIYERIIRTFTFYPSVEWVTVASVFQRMMDEGTPPSLDSLKIVLSVAGRNGMPVLPILRSVVEMDGLPEKMDSHLLVLVMKGLVREGGMKADALKALVEELRAEAMMEEGALDEIMVEAYGQEGDMRGILDTIAHHRSTYSSTSIPTKRSATLSLYLQALKQWTANPALRRKRRVSLFPRILAKDMVEIYGGTETLPLIWLNAWMNGERISGETRMAMTIFWRLIGTSADDYSFATYFKLSKLLPTEEADLRRTVRSHLASGSKVTVESVESGLSASFHHDDLPLALLLARRLLDTSQRNAAVLRPSERTIDLVASGIIRSQRPSPFDGQSSTPTSRPYLPEFITQHEWDAITYNLGLDGVTLPLSRPQARLFSGSGVREKAAQEETMVKTYLPDRGSKSAFLQRVLTRLVGLLEETIVYQNRALVDDRAEVLKTVMSELHSQVLPSP